METFRIAVIGCGFIAGKHLKAISYIYPRIVLAAVCDTQPERMDEVVENYYSALRNIHPDIEENKLDIKKFNHYDSLLDYDGFDIADITTVSGYHGPIALECLKAGKHTIVEKPMTLSLKDSDMLIECAGENRLKLGVCFQNRFNKTVQILKDAIKQDAFGKLVHAVSCTRWNRNNEYYKQAAWRGTWALDGGVLMNQCIHNIDLLQWIMGEAESVYSITDTFLRPIEAEDFGAALIRFRSGAVGIVEGSTCVYPRNLEQTLSIFGEKGTVCLGGPDIKRIRVWDFENGLPAAINTFEGAEYINLFLDFIDAIEKDRQPLIDGSEGRKALEIVLAAYMSSKTGQPVQLPLKEYSTQDMLRQEF